MNIAFFMGVIFFRTPVPWLESVVALALLSDNTITLYGRKHSNCSPVNQHSIDSLRNVLRWSHAPWSKLATKMEFRLSHSTFCETQWRHSVKTKLYNTRSPILHSVKHSDVTRWKHGYIRTLPHTCVSKNKYGGGRKGGRGHWVSQNCVKYIVLLVTFVCTTRVEHVSLNMFIIVPALQMTVKHSTSCQRKPSWFK